MRNLKYLVLLTISTFYSIYGVFISPKNLSHSRVPASASSLSIFLLEQNKEYFEIKQSLDELNFYINEKDKFETPEICEDREKFTSKGMDSLDALKLVEGELKNLKKESKKVFTWSKSVRYEDFWDITCKYFSIRKILKKENYFGIWTEFDEEDLESYEFFLYDLDVVYEKYKDLNASFKGHYELQFSKSMGDILGKDRFKLIDTLDKSIEVANKEKFEVLVVADRYKLVEELYGHYQTIISVGIRVDLPGIGPELKKELFDGIRNKFRFGESNKLFGIDEIGQISLKDEYYYDLINNWENDILEIRSSFDQVYSEALKAYQFSEDSTKDGLSFDDVKSEQFWLLGELDGRIEVYREQIREKLDLFITKKDDLLDVSNLDKKSPLKKVLKDISKENEALERIFFGNKGFDFFKFNLRKSVDNFKQYLSRLNRITKNRKRDFKINDHSNDVLIKEEIEFKSNKRCEVIEKIFESYNISNDYYKKSKYYLYGIKDLLPSDVETYKKFLGFIPVGLTSEFKLSMNEYLLDAPTLVFQKKKRVKNKKEQVLLNDKKYVGYIGINIFFFKDIQDQVAEHYSHCLN